MRAILYSATGEAATVFRIQDQPAPVPGKGDVLVAIRYSGINPSDVKTRSGWNGASVDQPVTPHNDGAGHIVAAGSGVPQERVGQRVWLYEASLQGSGTAAEFCRVPANCAVPLPETATLETGAMLGVPAMTAHRCLFADGPVAGLDVLVMGGGGAVGAHAVSLAKWAGARVVATTGSSRTETVARQAGADHVENYHSPDLRQRLQALAPDGFHRIIDASLAANLEIDVALSRRGGIIVAYASSLDVARGLTLPERTMLQKALLLRWVHVYSMPDAAKAQAVADITAALDDRGLSGPAVKIFPLDAIAAAHDFVGLGGAGVKALLSIE